MPTKPTLFYRSIEDYLGPGERRFFGNGYRRAEYQIGDISVTPGNASNADVQGVASLAYPDDWSTKGAQTDLHPHLSSIDALVISTQLSEICLAHAYGFDESMRRDMRLRKVTLRAGSAPQRILIDIPLSAKLRTTKQLADNGDRCVSSIDCRLGLMRARCEIEHRMALPANITGAYHLIEDILGSAISRYYGEGFKSREQRIEDVRVDMETLQSDARVHIEAMQGIDSGTEGINGNYQPSVSMIDCLVATAQMTQVMMYELDAVQRQNSNMLWMRHTILEEHIGTGTQDALSVDAQLAARGKDLLPLRGSMWRTLSVAGYCGGIAIQSSLVHALPSPIQV